MERDLSQSSVCRSGCGFYGNPATDGLCSKCYKLAVMRKQAVPPSSNSSAVGQSSNCPSPSLLPKKSPTPLIEADLAIATPSVPLPSSPAQSSSNSEASSKRDPSAEDIRSSVDVSKAGTSDTKSEEDASCSIITSSTSSSSNSKEPAEVPVKAKAKNRCHTCKAKIGVLGFPCRCGGNFCATHRYANEHNCTFDYKTHGQNEIRENNPKVLGQKIQKI